MIEQDIVKNNMEMRFSREANALLYAYDSESVRIEPWGKNSLRIRATKNSDFRSIYSALSEVPENMIADIDISLQQGKAIISNGIIRAEIDDIGVLSIYKREKLILREYNRSREYFTRDYSSPLLIKGREFKAIPGGDYSISVRFESLDDDEKIYGMGQYQMPYLNLKGTTLELAHRNAQASVPFYLSSLGYGFLWNNPAIGECSFGKNMTMFKAFSTTEIDYWVTVGDSPAEIEENYTNQVGRAPKMPDWGLGFWQSRMRYRNREELMAAARGYQKRGLPVDVIVLDFFHWTCQGEWKFDPVDWPDPKGMIEELKEMGMKLMVSVWPTVDYRSENFNEMFSKGLLVRTDRGFRITMSNHGDSLFFDATNPESRKFIWSKIKKNYWDLGIRIFWLDESEPEYSVYDYDNYRYYLGPNLQVGNVYPLYYAKAFWDGMKSAGQDEIVNLVRCAWVGSQKYGCLAWSGDIHSSFEDLRNQFAAGLNMGIAGIPWWTTDIGGFFGGFPDKPYFRELLIRWFEYALFSPVMRMHGHRLPHKSWLRSPDECWSGADNEVWSFGPEVEKILSNYLNMRNSMRAYTREVMDISSDNGSPVMRTVFYEFPEDGNAWDDSLEEFMYGPDVLVAPVMREGVFKRNVYLPKGAVWKDYWTGREYEGGVSVEVDAPIERIPFFLRDGARIFN